MRLAACIATALVAATPATLARAAPPRECEALARPSTDDLIPWVKAGPYAAGLKAFSANRDARAAADLRAAWDRIRADLAGAFATGQCREGAIKAALARRVFAGPPQAVPAEDRFLPPRPVAMAVAASLCAIGDLDGAAAWLVDATAADDASARAAAAMLWTAAGRIDAARALIPPGANGPAWAGARKAIEAPGRPHDAPGQEGSR